MSLLGHVGALEVTQIYSPSFHSFHRVDVEVWVHYVWLCRELGPEGEIQDMADRILGPFPGWELNPPAPPPSKLL